MTFQEAVEYLTADGMLLLDRLEGIRYELDSAYDDERSPRLSIQERKAYYIVCGMMRPLFYSN